MRDAVLVVVGAVADEAELLVPALEVRLGAGGADSPTDRRGPAPLNLALPPYEFVSDSKIRIGETSATPA